MSPTETSTLFLTTISTASKIVIFYSPRPKCDKCIKKRIENSPGGFHSGIVGEGLVACEERLANKRTNKSSYSCSCSSSYIRSYICSDKTLSILYCSPFIIPTASLSPPINYSQDSASISYAPFFCHFESLIACGDCGSFVCVIPVSFPSGVLPGAGDSIMMRPLSEQLT